jgi:5-methylcytosine-specific restriction protein A
MPTRAARICRTSSCPGPAHSGSYCAACRARLGFTDKPSATGSHWATSNKGSSAQRGYGSPWRKARRQALSAADYLCSHCRQRGRVALAREVHHVVPRAAGGTDALENLVAICTRCHRAATAQMQRSTSGGDVICSTEKR